MMPARQLAVAGCLLALGALIAVAPCPTPAASAQADAASAFSPWVGTYHNRARDGGAAAIEHAVDAGIDSMGPLMERIARRRILDSNPPFETLRISIDGSNLSVEYVGARRYSAPAGGGEADNQSPDGSDVRVSFQLRNGRLRERVVADQGSSTNVYRLSSNGQTLQLRSTMQSEHLPAPIRYTLRFRR